ncbi:hypothetical protein GFL58_30645 [Rhizobium leguminosarum bv. viciae]|uniref:hypothetical protein n=1 Tax=Rhizobium leguminosarum TaxID=384 RepID=UPI00143F21F4|nr:hypothetical protein [Rhizobium leguminosarum]NKM65278.1 hypothetical protein [Rhizobium leguminosarum bv. viciae]
MTPEQERLLMQINADFEEYHRVVNANLRIKRMPHGPGFRLRDFDKYAEFLDSSPSEQAEFMQTLHPDEVEFYEQLAIARAEYEIAEERGAGPITQEKVDRYPDRYKREPGE